MEPEQALKQLLPGTWIDLELRQQQDGFHSLEGRSRRAASCSVACDRGVRSDEVYADEALTQLGEIQVLADPRRVLPTEASTSAFGFSKQLLETPRAVSFISEESIGLFGLSAVEDLVRVVPGAFTTTRFGIQGSVDLRNVPADFYFRGMKRLSLQGHGRSVLAAMDTIEVVRGPPSPIYGMGKIGGYVNAVPTSGRAKSGAYLERRQGFLQGIAGAYDRRGMVLRTGRSDVDVGQGGRLLRLRAARRLGLFCARRAGPTGCVSGRDLRGRFHRAVPSRDRRQLSALADRRRADRKIDAGPRRLAAATSAARLS